jgi:TolB-like protein
VSYAARRMLPVAQSAYQSAEKTAEGGIGGIRLRRLRRLPLLPPCVVVLLVAVAAAAEDRTRIVILPIVVHSAAANPSYVSRGITDMISSRLEQTGRVQVERVDDPNAATTVLGKALDLGKARGGDYLIFGAFTQFGEGASLDVHCLPLDVKSEAEAAAARRIFISSGVMGDIIPKLDEIVDRVAVYTKVGPIQTAPGAAPAPPPDVLRELTRRLDALEKAVFKEGPPPPGGASGPNTAAQGAAIPPES